VNDIAELKQYMLLHARVQGMSRRRYRQIVSGVDTDAAWVARWCAEARTHEQAGELLGAVRCYNLARFPYVDGPARQQALDDCVGAFDRWRAAETEIERLDVECLGGRVRCWTIGLSATEPRPLVVLTGGTVSIKEQWAPLLPEVAKLGLAAVAAEMPSVGENTIRYGPDSWQMLSAIIDAVAGRADTSTCYALCPSFSGHLALRCAAADPRIRGVVTASAPVSRFFTDPQWRSQVPRIAMDTLAHLTGGPVTDMTGWALDGQTLSAVRVPVHYMMSLRDEIVPPGEADVLRAHLPQLHLIANDDVHGSPRHTLESRLWVVLALNHLRGQGGVQVGALRGLLAVLRGWSSVTAGARLVTSPTRA
jgi:esterase FrsA